MGQEIAQLGGAGYLQVVCTAIKPIGTINNAGVIDALLIDNLTRLERGRRGGCGGVEVELVGAGEKEVGSDEGSITSTEQPLLHRRNLLAHQAIGENGGRLTIDGKDGQWTA